MDTIKLRTLTKRSKIGFGQFADLTVNEIIILRRKAYLRWLYYNIDGLTFLDEIIEEIGILNEYKITKPGKNPDIYRQLDANVFEAKRDNFYYKQHMSKYNKNKKKAEEIKTLNKERFYCKKSVNQNRNIKH